MKRSMHQSSRQKAKLCLTNVDTYAPSVSSTIDLKSSFNGPLNYSREITLTSTSRQRGNQHKRELTEYDKEYLASIYAGADYKKIVEKYNIPTHLSYDERSEIYHLMVKKDNRMKKESNITFSTSNNSDNDAYSDPYKTLRILKAKSNIQTTLQNANMKTQIEKFYQKIDSIKATRKAIEKIRHIRVTKLNRAHGKNQKRVGSIKVSEEVLKQIQPGKLQKTRLKGVLSRDQLLNEVKLTFGCNKNAYHPSARGQFSFCITDDDKLYIFGGVLSKKMCDLWRYSLSTIEDNENWQKIEHNEDDSPVPRYGHSMCFYNNQLFIYGGSMYPGYWKCSEDSVAVYNIVSNQYFFPICEKSKNVPQRHNHIGIGVGSTMVVHGGIGVDGNFLNDIWVLDLVKNKWSPLMFRSKSRLPQIAFHTGCLVITRHSVEYHYSLNVYKVPDLGNKAKSLIRPKIEGIYVFGGVDRDGNYNNNLWVIRVGTKPVDIINLKTKGEPPSPRMSCGMCFIREINLLVVHGGKNNMIGENTIFNDIMLLDLENFNWIRPIFDESKFLYFCEHINFVYGNTIYILGGFNNEGFHKFDFFTIDFDYLLQQEKFNNEVMKK